jgi:hypothetical protein
MELSGGGGYRGVAAALLRSGFEAVWKPQVDRVKDGRETAQRVKEQRVKEWLFLFSPEAQMYADALDLDLEKLRLVAWNEGIVRRSGSHEWRTQRFCEFPELASYPPLRRASAHRAAA